MRTFLVTGWTVFSLANCRGQTLLSLDYICVGFETCVDKSWNSLRRQFECLAKWSIMTKIAAQNQFTVLPGPLTIKWPSLEWWTDLWPPTWSCSLFFLKTFSVSCYNRDREKYSICTVQMYQSPISVMYTTHTCNIQCRVPWTIPKSLFSKSLSNDRWDHPLYIIQYTYQQQVLH